MSIASMSYLKLINRKLEKYFSIKFVKVHKAKIIDLKGSIGSNVIVEFLGPPGVGKTYLCDFFIQKYRDSFSSEVITRGDLQNQNIGEVELSEMYSELLNYRIRDISNTSKSGINKYRSIKHEHQLLKNDIICNDFLSDSLIITDEQLFKTFGEYAFKIASPEKMRRILKNRVFILCTASPATIFSNQQKKNKDFFISIEWLTERIAKDVVLVQHLRKYGSEVLEINTENGLEFNSKEIYSFINTTIIKTKSEENKI